MKFEVSLMKVIVIGGVAAGMSCASKVKRSDSSAQITVYERGGFLSYGACGLPYYVGGFNDDYRKMIARTKEFFEKQGIKCFLKPYIFHEFFPTEGTKLLTLGRYEVMLCLLSNHLL